MSSEMFNSLMPSGFFHLIIWTDTFLVRRVSCLLFLLLLLIEISVFNANSVD